ncbi:proton-conducting transporter membrane subunit [Rhodoferax sp.]|uniref:complex I subunit 5 family protein n=1 Tax=Rhodoferax sp. TaxID=50421 RepID=UPI0026074C20|nr:proton-conducting transporter membrane subunit [Rhodoferax sp.]MDD2809982.1 proton-conducting transporter membrane subunit [Rhodoferax sp.]
MTALTSIANQAAPSQPEPHHRPTAAELTEELIHGTHWISPALVGVALLMWLTAMAVFLTHPLSELPLYFANRYLVLDATSMLFIVVINTVFLGICVYLYSRERNTPQLTRDIRSRAALMLLFMAVINIGMMAHHLVLLWTLIEISTLCAAPLVARGDGVNARATAWRYMLYSSITLAITFLGFMALTQSAHLRGVEVSFMVDQLGDSLTRENDAWQRLGLSFMLFGLGGKLGLAPLYGWLPETYEAAPTTTSALLASVQFNISVVAVFRILQIFHGFEAGFVSQELLIMGYISLVVAAIQIMASKNYKRLIAYACVSSSGVIALGLSVGKAAAYGVVLYIVSNAFVKSLLFLTAGRMRGVYGTNEVGPLSGLIRTLPVAGLLFALGIFALLGFPPFASFLAEMLILSGIVQAGNLLAFTLMCVMLTVIFVATGRTVFPMLWGTPKVSVSAPPQSWITLLPKLGFVAVLVMLGTYTPDPITDLLRAVAVSIGG